MSAMTFGMEQRILSEQINVAEAHGDEGEMTRLTQQLLQSQKDCLSQLEKDNPYRYSLQAVIILTEVLPSFNRGSKALREMNLDLAQQYLEDSSQSASRALRSIDEVDSNNITLSSIKDLITGIALWIRGDFIYIKALRTSILGGVSKKHIRDLEKVERDFLDAADLIKKAFASGADVAWGKGIDFSSLAQQSDISKNFRALCERSLSPQKVAQIAAPKVVLFFLGTFLVLVFGLPASGLISELTSRDLGFVLIVSMFVSVIGTFGFEANRLIPIFDIFTKMLPWSSGNKDESKI
jgi:hypothetical protein